MTNEIEPSQAMLPESRRPIPPAPIHPLAALATIVLDNVFGVFELVDPLAKHRGFLAAAQHALQRQRALHAGLGMPGKKLEKPFFPGKKGAEPAHQHGVMSIVAEMAGRDGLSHRCHKPFSGESA